MISCVILTFANVSGRGIPKSALLIIKAAIPCGKHTKEGEQQRLNRLRPHFGDQSELWIKNLNLPESANNDVIDAFAMLWTARRVARGSHRILGGETDPNGIRAEILV